MYKKHLKLFLFVVACFGVQLLFAQEVLLPLRLNAVLKNNNTNQLPEFSARKSGALSVPFIDYFENDGAPNSQFWADSLVQISNRTAVFNNLDANDNQYESATSDQLSSLPIDLNSLRKNLYFGFQIATGSSFVVGDSLVLEFLNSNQVWNKVWGSTVLLNKFKEIQLPIDPKEYTGSGFAFRFTLFSKSQQRSDNIYLLRQVVLAPILSVPFAIDNSNKANKSETFLGLDVQLQSDVFSPELGTGFVLDAYNFKQQAYGNNFRSADTLAFHPLSLLSCNPKDSVFLSFTLKTLNGWKLTDTLVFECKNNLGNWVPMLNFHGPTNSITTYNFPVNFGRFRHAFFAGRWCLKSTAEIADTAKIFVSAIQLYKQIKMPFMDDFSLSKQAVDANKWQNNFVYVNNEFPENQPSINVATFDGLNEKGNPYSSYAIKGTADVLNTWSFDISKSTAADSIYLSFYCQYELQGTSEQIFPDDSFVVEYRSSKYQSNLFVPLKSISAIEAQKHQFTHYFIALKDSACFHDKFEIRFRNRGSLTGNLSQWHLDYVYLNKGRTLNDALNDVSLTNTPHPYLGNYFTMPWAQYSAAKSSYPVDTAFLRFMNHDNQSFVLDYSRTTLDADGNTLAQYKDFTNIESLSDTLVKFLKPIPFTTSSTSADTIVFNTHFQLGFSSAKNDLIPSNDSITVPVFFSNFLAYDDGSAEAGYGIKNKTNCGAALKFEIAIPDTLYGVYLYFNQSEKNVANQQFGLRVWSDITAVGLPANDDKILYRIDNLNPVYLNAVNAYSYLKFNQPVPVSGKFYIGWEQAQSYVLNIGLDKNYPFGINNNLYFKQDGQWYPTAIVGTPMMRPVIGKWLDVPAAILEPKPSNKNLSITLFPNPGNGNFHVQSNFTGPIHAQVFDLSGRNIFNTQTALDLLDLSTLTNGMYLLKLTHEQSKETQTKRILIQK